MPRYELGKPDFELLDEALMLASRAKESGHRIAAKLASPAHHYRDLANRFRTGYTAWIDKDE